MNKQQFMNALAEALKKLPREERYRTLSYYDELIDDRMEDGQNEYAAVESLGPVAAIAQELLGVEEEKPRKEYGNGTKAWITVLLVLGFPLWGSLLIVAAALVLVLYILLYIPIIVLGALAVGLFAGALWGMVGTPFLVWNVGLLAGGIPAGIFQFGACILVLGLSLLSAVALYHTTKAIVRASKIIWSKCVTSFRRRGRAA